jgi:hypothetical protein
LILQAAYNIRTQHYVVVAALSGCLIPHDTNNKYNEFLPIKQEIYLLKYF